MRLRLGMYPTPQARNPYGRFDSRRKALTFIEELSKELLYIKPRHERINPRTFEFDVYEYDKGIYIVDVKGIKGYVAGEEDLLNTNWWALFLGSIRETNPSDVVDTGGTARDLRASSIPVYSAAYISYGTGTTPESFVDRTLMSRVGSISTSISVGYLSDRIRITLSGTIPSTSYELGIEQSLFTTVATVYTALLGRKTGSWSANTAVAWYIDFLSPWVRGVGDYVYGVHRKADVTMVRIDGTSFTAKTSGDANAGSAYLVASSDLVSWSPTLIAISNAFSLSNYYADILGTRYIRATFMHGLYSPANDIAVNTIGLYFPVYDTLGASQTVCILVQPLSSPITLYASRNNLIVLRIIAF
jgi:hypothetical protein